MDKEINIREVQNGYEVTVNNTSVKGIYVFKSNEEILMLEQVGKWLTTRKVVVKER